MNRISIKINYTAIMIYIPSIALFVVGILIFISKGPFSNDLETSVRGCYTQWKSSYFQSFWYGITGVSIFILLDIFLGKCHNLGTFIGRLLIVWFITNGVLLDLCRLIGCLLRYMSRLSKKTN